jgi:DNA-directed RNA polymerase specialized sigma24 family protein
MPRPAEHELREARLLAPDASDDELIGAMAKKHVDVAVATAALEEFIRRHRTPVYRMCSNLVDRYGTASGWTQEQFAEQVFARVYKSAHTYRAVTPLSPGGKLRRLKGWMGRIANNLLIDKHRRCTVALFDDEFLKVLESPLEQRDFPNRIQKLLCEAVQQLTDKERLVYVRTLRYMQADSRRHSRLPNAVSRALRDELQTTAANIRKIRERAKRKIHAYLSDHGEDVGNL